MTRLTGRLREEQGQAAKLDAMIVAKVREIE